MQIVRYALNTGIHVGVHTDETVAPIAADSIGSLLQLTADELRSTVTDTGQPISLDDVDLLPPVDGRMEVWAAGVTYQQSRTARVEESKRAATVYEQVYDAERPEIFFKSVAWKVVGHGQTIAVREDSEIDVPEPELAAVVNARGEIVGYTVCDDVSSRSIEGENPLYLPQAKVFLGGCAVGPGIRPAWEIPDVYDLGIHLTIHRAGNVVWHGEASTGQLHRKIDELVGYLHRADSFPDGVVLSTGTCLVPEMPFSLAEGDEVEIAIDEVGKLTTPVVRGIPKEVAS